MSLKVNCLNYCNKRFDFGVPLEDVFPPNDLHPRLKYLFEEAYTLSLESGLKMEQILRQHQGSLETRLKLKEKIVYDIHYHIIRSGDENLPGAYFWLIRHFLGMLPIPLLPDYAGQTQFYWNNLSESCHRFLRHYYENDRRNICQMDYKIAEHLNMLPFEHFLLLCILVIFMRKLSLKPTCHRQISRRTLICLAKYFCPALSSRPYRPGHDEQNEKIFPLFFYLLLRWRYIEKNCRNIGHPAYFLEMDCMNFNNYRGVSIRDSSVQTDRFLSEIITVHKNVPYFCDNNNYLKDIGCQTENSTFVHKGIQLTEGIGGEKKEYCYAEIDTKHERTNNNSPVKVDQETHKTFDKIMPANKKAVAGFHDYEIIDETESLRIKLDSKSPSVSIVHQNYEIIEKTDPPDKNLLIKVDEEQYDSFEKKSSESSPMSSYTICDSYVIMNSSVSSDRSLLIKTDRNEHPSCTQDYEIMEKKAALDNSLPIKVDDKESATVGHGYEMMEETIDNTFYVQILEEKFKSSDKNLPVCPPYEGYEIMDKSVRSNRSSFTKKSVQSVPEKHENEYEVVDVTANEKIPVNDIKKKLKLGQKHIDKEFGFGTVDLRDNKDKWSDVVKETMKTVNKVDEYIYDDYETFSKEDFNQISSSSRNDSSLFDKISKMGWTYTPKRNKKHTGTGHTDDKTDETQVYFHHSYFKFQDVVEEDSNCRLNEKPNIAHYQFQVKDNNPNGNFKKKYHHTYFKFKDVEDNSAKVNSLDKNFKKTSHLKIPLWNNPIYDKGGREIDDNEPKRKRSFSLKKIKINLDFLRVLTPKKKIRHTPSYDSIESNVKYKKIKNVKSTTF